MENMKIDVEKLKSIVISTISDNRELIGAVLGTVLTAKLCKAFDIPVGNLLNYRNSFGAKTIATAGPLTITIAAPKNSYQTGIFSIYKNAISLDSDYYKLEEVKRIYKTIKNAPLDAIDDETRSYAIEAITGIQISISSAYYKSECSKYIDGLLKL